MFHTCACNSTMLSYCSKGKQAVTLFQIDTDIVILCILPVFSLMSACLVDHHYFLYKQIACSVGRCAPDTSAALIMWSPTHVQVTGMLGI